MLELHYPTALKLGQKEYRRRTLRGEYPYLPALDDMLTDQAGLATVSLGSVQIPAEFVVGTKTAGRATSFAADFMPLLQSKTEFAIKWENLCQAHLKEGIRDSVVAYEYMNRYYIAEGNKRCSVLKYFGAATIPAIVTRILPEKTDAPENRLYYEYLDFYRVSRVNFISCSRLGSYKKLLQRLGKKPQEVWTEEETLSFQRFYYSFRKVYESMGGKKLMVTAADAMLVFACGLLLALIISWNVDVSETGEITKQPNVKYEVENIGEAVEEDAEVTENLKDMGRVYQDPATGKYYVVEE